jgi:hypothetical protein
VAAAAERSGVADGQGQILKYETGGLLHAVAELPCTRVAPTVIQCFSKGQG